VRSRGAELAVTKVGTEIEDYRTTSGVSGVDIGAESMGMGRGATHIEGARTDRIRWWTAGIQRQSK
jgi:hypothetical protein